MPLCHARMRRSGTATTRDDARSLGRLPSLLRRKFRPPSPRGQKCCPFRKSRPHVSMVEAMKNRDGSDVARYLGLATTRSILGQRQMCLRDRLQQGPEVVQFRGTVLQVDAEGMAGVTSIALSDAPETMPGLCKPTYGENVEFFRFILFGTPVRPRHRALARVRVRPAVSSRPRHRTLLPRFWARQIALP